MAVRGCVRSAESPDMCGFVLAYARSDGAPLPTGVCVERMAATIGHRGPDQHGHAVCERVAMAHRRLAIIDLAGGRQPMCTPDGRFWLVFNGEIYNFRTLRAELAAAGYPLDTESDTEVLLHAYRVWGAQCLERLNGMFAFAVYDASTQSLFAARDRFGEKPLYVLETDSTVYLSSELKALVEAGLVAKRFDPMALYEYFTTCYVAGPRTIFRGVRRLQAGHSLTVHDSDLRVARYWAPPSPTNDLTNENDIVGQVLDTLRDSVRLRLVADTRVGLFLSGGVDSSAVVALASETSSRPLETFSVGFSDPRYDERAHARFVAKRFGTRHHEFVLEPSGIDVIERIAWHLDEPFADSSALPSWHLSLLTRQHVRVALSGDGGDEMFAGYDSYRGHLLSERLLVVPSPLRSLAAAALRTIPTRDAGRRAARLRLARNIADAAMPARERFVAKQQQVFRRVQLAGMSPYLAPYATAASDRALFAPLFDPECSPLAGMTLWQQSVSLVDDMLVKVDRMSMAHSLEVRAPFLDHRLAELMNRVAFDTKLPGGRQKYILRKAMERYLPADFLWRRKQGFEAPIRQWFRSDVGDYIVQKVLAPTAMVGHLFGRDVLETLVGEHRRLKRDRGAALWALVMFETWCKRYGVGPEAFAD
jgi:asparagine synthase (glutamine-hydrolysing)